MYTKLEYIICRSDIYGKVGFLHDTTEYTYKVAGYGILYSLPDMYYILGWF